MSHLGINPGGFTPSTSPAHTGWLHGITHHAFPETEEIAAAP